MWIIGLGANTCVIMHMSDSALSRHPTAFHHDNNHDYQLERCSTAGLERQPAMPMEISYLGSKAAHILHPFSSLAEIHMLAPFVPEKSKACSNADARPDPTYVTDFSTLQPGWYGQQIDHCQNPPRQVSNC